MTDKKAACRQAFTQALQTLAQADRCIYAVTSDARGSVTLENFATALPERLIEVGIAEQNEVGVAAGMALTGKTVFVCAPAPFLSARSFEQIKLDVAYNNANVKIVGVSGGVSYGALGGSHHSLHDFAAMCTLENLTVLAPCDATQTKRLTEWMAQKQGPVYMRMGRSTVPVLYDDTDTFEVGRAQCLCTGQDLTIIAAGEMVAPALEAAQQMYAQGVSVRVLDMFTLRPLDEKAICAAARETGCILTIEEHSVSGGLGAAVAQITARYAPVPMRMMGLPNEHLYAGETQEVFDYYGLNSIGIVREAQQLLLQKSVTANQNTGAFD